jgi:hypothetical protein
MDVQQPWLAEFIKSGLGAWFHKLGGTPTDQYSFRKVDDVLRFTQTTKNARTVRLLKVGIWSLLRLRSLSITVRSYLHLGSENLEAKYQMASTPSKPCFQAITLLPFFELAPRSGLFGVWQILSSESRHT